MIIIIVEHSRKETFDRQSMKRLVESLPKLLFKGKWGLSEEAFQEGLDNGDIEETCDPTSNKALYSCTVVSTEREQGKCNSGVLGAKQQKLSDEQGKVISNVWESLQWRFQQIGASSSAASSSQLRPRGAAGQALALKDIETGLSQKQWDQAQGLFSNYIC